MPHILYSFRRCPYAIRARMALLTAGIELEHREIKLSAKPAAFLAVASPATVPVLVTQDGRVLQESLDILFWSLQQHDPLGWLDLDKAQQIAAERMLSNNDNGFKAALDQYKYSYDDEARALAGRQIAAEYLFDLQEKVRLGGFLLGEKSRWIDIAIMPFVRQFAMVDKTWFDQEFPQLEQWLQGWMDTSLWQKVMVKHPLWHDADSPT